MKRIIIILMMLCFANINLLIADDAPAWKRAKIDQKIYKVLKIEANELFDKDKYAEAGAKYLKAAETSHADRFIIAKAWMLNNAGYSYILAKDYRKAYEVLKVAIVINYDNDKWKKIVNKNYNFVKSKIE